MQQLSAPIFIFEGIRPLPPEDAYTRAGIPTGQLALSGPSEVPESGNLPVRGDLAHIRLAGHYFVPHYAVPMPHRAVAGGATLRQSGSPEAVRICTVAAGELFDVLDMSGGWAWGECGTSGPVGYVVLTELEAIT